METLKGFMTQSEVVEKLGKEFPNRKVYVIPKNLFRFVTETLREKFYGLYAASGISFPNFIYYGDNSREAIDKCVNSLACTYLIPPEAQMPTLSRYQWDREKNGFINMECPEMEKMKKEILKMLDKFDILVRNDEA